MNYSLQNYGNRSLASKPNPDAKLGFGAFAVGVVGAWAINAALNSAGMQRAFADSGELPSGQREGERVAAIGFIASFYTIGVLLGAKAAS